MCTLRRQYMADIIEEANKKRFKVSVVPFVYDIDVEPVVGEPAAV